MELNNALQALTDLKLEQQILAYFFKVCGAEDTLVRVMRIAPQWFGGQGNARLFRVLRTYLRKNPGCSIHSSAVKRHIDNRWGLDSTDGAEAAIAFAEVHTLNDVPKANQIGPLISELEDLYTKRVMAEALLEELGNIQHSSARKVASRVLGVAAQVGKGVAHTISSDRAIVRCERLITKLSESRSTPGVPSGIPQLDAQMLGFYPSRLYAVAARPGGGKSRLLLNLAWNQAVKMNLPVLYFSLEMSAADLSVLIASRTLELNYMNLFRGNITADEMKRLKHLRKEWSKEPPPFSIVDLPGKATAVELHREMENYKVTHGRIPRCIFIDYAGIMSSTHEKREAQKYEQLDDVFRDLKQFARDWKVPVITALQLNRESVKADRVGLEHVSLSDLPGHHCDTVWALSQREADVEQTAVDMTFLKQRYGSKKPLVLWANWPMSYLGEVPAVQQQKLNEQAQADAQNVAHAKDL